ncbi:MAG: hypothetical protein KIT84_33580 [Labilithrix sp.]|nr:hypothetical protein [Labilithrix sp.]MCW5815979.1 hypothetical protein [Labilithrix sp.]
MASAAPSNPQPPTPSAAPVVSLADGAVDPTLRTKWGAGDNELGHLVQAEGNPEGPMSLARAGDDLLVLDQVNNRIVRYSGGKQVGSFAATATTQDVVVAKDGTIVTLDRLKEKSLRFYDKDGRERAQLSIPTDRVKDPGLVTGLFTDDKDVYLEESHGALVRIGTTDGRLADAVKLSGRPSKDGKLLVSATLVGSKLTVNAFDRASGTLRFARVIPYPEPTREVALLDTDARGIIYAGVGGEEAVTVACLEPAEGKVIGRVAIESSMMPEEAFKDFIVTDDGTIQSSFRTEDGVEYRVARCP